MNTAKLAAYMIVAVAGTAIFATALSRITAARDPYVEVPRERYPIVGVDLSAHNGKVDFGRVAAGGVDFVMLKASEGVSFRDPQFEDNYIAACSAGMKVGAYHFFRFDCDGKLQARHFLATVGDRRLDLPLAIDVEDNGNPGGFTPDEIALRLGNMIDCLDSAGRRVIIYSNKRGLSRYVRGRFDKHQMWVCSFTNPPLANDNWTLWQHSHRSRVDGIDGDVDLNTFNGDSTDWKHWLAGHGSLKAPGYNN